MTSSPYDGLAIDEWEAKTRELIDLHPLDANLLYDLVLHTWNDLFESKIGSKPFQIGKDLFPQPQIMGFFLHELIPLQLELDYPSVWRRNTVASEKDLVYIPDDTFSVEIKTSSSAGSIYGNRSYAQVGQSSRKIKSGYYLAINFQKFSANLLRPAIASVRFGWLDHEDWQGQTAATGQQARLQPAVERYKLLKLPFK
jgi:hypothetical protein